MLSERSINFSSLEAKGKQFYQPKLMSTTLHFLVCVGGGGDNLSNKHSLIKYRDKNVQIAVLIFPYHERL